MLGEAPVDFSELYQDHRKASAWLKTIIRNQHTELSSELSHLDLQSASHARNLILARQISHILIDPNTGILSEPFLKRTLRMLAHNLYGLGALGSEDVAAREHVFVVLKQLYECEALRRQFAAISAPIANPKLEHILRLTLQMEDGKKLSDADAKRAVLFAWLTYLRQSIGSCFATAPAILIQHDQGPQFLTDMACLLNRGRLARVYHGIEYTVPISESWGIGDLNRPLAVSQLTLLAEHPAMLSALTNNPLLKAWEFTLASFSDAKSEFCQWNLYSSLGLFQNEANGIGEYLFKEISGQIETANAAAKRAQDHYEASFHDIRRTEDQLNYRASEGQWWGILPQYRAQVCDLNGLIKTRDEHISHARRMAKMFTFLIEQYQKYFSHFFQEIYDADLGEEMPDLYEDRPAGFRLLYKANPNKPAQWKRIHSAADYKEALSSFFLDSEFLIRTQPEMEGLELYFSGLVSAMAERVKSDAFLTSSLERMARFHGAPLPKKPLENLDQIRYKPWAYSSGGSMETLISCYYDLEYKPKLTASRIHDASRLFLFLLQSIKDLPAYIQSDFIKSSHASLLMQSPTHGFAIKPGFLAFKQAWQSPGNALSYIEEWVAHRQQFYQQQWPPLACKDIFQQFAKSLPTALQNRFLSHLSMPAQALSSMKIARQLKSALTHIAHPSRQTHLNVNKEDVDAFLYAALPLMPKAHLKQNVRSVFEKLPKHRSWNMEQIGATLASSADTGSEFLTASQFHQLCKQILSTSAQRKHFSIDYEQAIQQAAIELGFAAPSALVFADSNWVDIYFSFVVNPSRQELEFWKTDRLGRQGKPAAFAKDWFDASSDREWAIFIKPQQYDSGNNPIGDTTPIAKLSAGPNRLFV